MVSIDEEIEQLKKSLDSLEDTHPDYISSRLKELQTKVLAAHAHLENALETRIYMQLKRSLAPIVDEHWFKAISIVEPMLNALSYRNKIEIVKSYNDETPGLIKALEKVNKYRIEFAHPKGMKLRNKYDIRDPKCKENIRDVLRCLYNAKREMDNYFIKIEGVPKMRDKTI